MIEVKNVVKSFDGFHALDGVTMTVPKGAIYGLVGPNGAGKSTILRHLCGAYRPSKGKASRTVPLCIDHAITGNLRWFRIPV